MDVKWLGPISQEGTGPRNEQEEQMMTVTIASHCGYEKQASFFSLQREQLVKHNSSSQQKHQTIHPYLMKRNLLKLKKEKGGKQSSKNGIS